MPTNIVAQFQVFSNLLALPSFLICPDRVRPASPAKDFASLAPKNIQFFVGLSASKNNASSILGGESELRVDAKPAQGLVAIKKGAAITYPKKFHKNKNSPSVVFGDGHVDSVPDERWLQCLAASGLDTNLFLAP